jgi:hypothetical protein
MTDWSTFISGAVVIDDSWLGVAVAKLDTLQRDNNVIRCAFDFLPRPGIAILPVGRLELRGFRRVWTHGMNGDIFNGFWLPMANHWVKVD